MEQLVISDITIDIVRKKIKNMHLAVYPPSGRVRLAVPLQVHGEAVRLFAISKLAWIKRNRRKFEEQERLSPREYGNRESHYFQGRRYLLHVHENAGRNEVVVRNKTYIDLYVREGNTQADMQRIMNSWYRGELKRIVPELVAQWENRIGVRVQEWGIKQMKTKWGSCNIEKKRIWINLEMAKKPVRCLEYIVVHEMVHLLERHHNDNFTAYMDRFLPNWRQLRDELNRLPVSHADWKY